jgi:hypothetical protein
LIYRSWDDDMTNQMMAAAAERTSAADIQQLVQYSRCSAAAAPAPAALQYAAVGVVQLVQEQ